MGYVIPGLRVQVTPTAQILMEDKMIVRILFISIFVFLFLSGLAKADENFRKLVELCSKNNSTACEQVAKICKKQCRRKKAEVVIHLHAFT